MDRPTSNASRKTQKAVQLPSVQLIGAQKAGTSAIADWLFENGGFCRPRVFPGEPEYYSKEVHFFDDEYRYQQGREFYARRFECCTSQKNGGHFRTMDATPDTLQFAERVRLTYEAAGGNQASSVKIIVILRDPIARELSLYNHLAYDCRRLSESERSNWHRQVLQADGTVLSFHDFVVKRSIPALQQASGQGRSTRHSLYFNHLREWFALFDRDQIIVLSYSELLHNPRRIQQRIQAFLEMTIHGELCRSNSNDSPSKTSEVLPTTQQALATVFKGPNEALYTLLDSNPGPPMEQRPFPRFET